MKVYKIEPVLKGEKPLHFLNKWAAEDTIKETMPDNLSEEELKKAFENLIETIEVIE